MTVMKGVNTYFDCLLSGLQGTPKWLHQWKQC